MYVKEILLNKVLKIENEKTNQVFIVQDDKSNTHIILMKEVLNNYQLKTKAFIMSFNEFKLSVNQYELMNSDDLNKDNVLDYLTKKNLLNKSILINDNELIQDLNYAYNLSKRYVINERDNELLKSIFGEVEDLPYNINDSEDVLSDILLMTVFPNYKTLDFIQHIEQLIYLPKNELKSLIHLNLTTDVVLENHKFLKLISKKVFLNEKNQKFVQRIDISPFVLFENDGKLAEFLKLINIIPYNKSTECHFYLNKEYLMEELFNHVDVSIDDFLIRSYKEANLIQEDLQYVFFVEQLKKIQDRLHKLESLKGYSDLFEKEKEFLFNKMNENVKSVGALDLIDYLNQIDENIKDLNVNYPTYHLYEWLINKEFITNELYYVKPITNHKEFYEYVPKHLLNNNYKYFFKQSGIDYIVIYNKQKQEIVLEIERVQNYYELKQIHSVRKSLTEKEKFLITQFCNINNIKFKAKRYLLLR